MSTLNLPREITNDLDSKGLLIGSKMKNYNSITLLH